MALPIRKGYSGAPSSAVLTNNPGSNPATDTTFAVDTVTNWPATFPFFCVVDPGTSREEKVKVTGVASLNLTVVRAADNTTIFSHSAGAEIYPVFTALEADEANQVASALTTKGDIIATNGSTINRLAVGTNGQVLQADSSSTNGIKWAATAINSVLKYQSGLYYRTPVELSTTSTATLNTLYFVAMLTPSDVVLDRISINAGSTFSGTAVVRLGLYKEVNGAPGDLILDAGTVSCTAALNEYEITISQTIPAGYYFLAAVMQTAATTSTFLGSRTGSSYNPWQISRYNAITSGTSAGFAQTSVSGALPSTATATTSGGVAFFPSVRAV